MAITVKETRIVRHAGKIGIHVCDVDVNTRQVMSIDPEPMRLEMKDDGGTTMHLDLISMCMDAIASHRRAKINGAGDLMV